MIRHNFTNSEIAFFSWLERSFPRLASAYASRMAETPGLGATDATSPTAPQSAPSTMDKFLSFLKEVAPLYLQTRQQRDLIKLNLERAKRGEAPIEAEQIALQGRAGLTGDTKSTLYILGGLFAAAMIIPALLKRRA